MIVSKLKNIDLGASIMPFTKDAETTVNPTVTDDSSLDYAVKSRWINTTTGAEFV